MSKQKIQQLANKFADYDQKFQEQRIRLENLFQDFSAEFKSILREMEGDIHTLQLKRFDPDLLKIFYKLWFNLSVYNKQLRKDDIHSEIDRIVRYVLSKQILSTIDNLDFLIQHFLKQTKEDLPAEGLLTQIKINSLKKLKTLVLETRDYFKKYPPVDVPGTIPPPLYKALNEGEEPEHQQLGPQDKTKVVINR